MGFAPKCAAIDVRPQDGRDPSHCRCSSHQNYHSCVTFDCKD